PTAWMPACPYVDRLARSGHSSISGLTRGRARMLKAIRKFVIERGRGIEEDRSTRESDDAMQSGETQSEPSAEKPVRGTVKWFNPIKGYGFVALSDGSGDVFLHASALAGIGITNLQPGETLEFRVALGQRGRQVTEVISVDSSTAVP